MIYEIEYPVRKLNMIFARWNKCSNESLGIGFGYSGSNEDEEDEA
jgi:hypothetical protein